MSKQKVEEVVDAVLNRMTDIEKVRAAYLLLHPEADSCDLLTAEEKAEADSDVACSEDEDQGR